MNLIRDAMASRGWNQKRLADETCISESTISRYFTGERLPSLMNCKIICDVLDLDYYEVMNEIIKEDINHG